MRRIVQMTHAPWCARCGLARARRRCAALDRGTTAPDSLQKLREEPTGSATADPQLPIVRGTLDLLVLRALSWGPMHGFEITTWLEERSAGMLEIVDSALYQALARLAARGCLAGGWGVTPDNRRARYYGLTAAGRPRLDAERANWVRYAHTVTDMLTDTDPTPGMRPRRA